MTAIISVDPGQLNTLSSKFNQHQQSLDAELKAMQQQIEDLAGTWQGLGQQAFSAQMAKWSQDYQQMLTVLSNFQQLLSVASSSYTENEQQIAAKLNQIM